MSRSSLRFVLGGLAVGGVLLAGPPAALAQTPGHGHDAEGPTIKTGRLLELDVKGRVTTLKIETTDGETYEVKVTPMLDFSIVGGGDAAFVKPGMYLSARGVMAQEKIFVQNLTIHVFPKGKRPPPGRFVKAQARPGESLALYELSGEIASVGPAEDYPDYTAVVLKVPGRNPPVWLEKNFQVRVSSTDPAHASAGADLELALRPVRGGKLFPVGVRIQREAPFTAEEVLKETDEK